MGFFDFLCYVLVIVSAVFATGLLFLAGSPTGNVSKRLIKFIVGLSWSNEEISAVTILLAEQLRARLGSDTVEVTAYSIRAAVAAGLPTGEITINDQREKAGNEA